LEGEGAPAAAGLEGMWDADSFRIWGATLPILGTRVVSGASASTITRAVLIEHALLTPAFLGLRARFAELSKNADASARIGFERAG
jgi:hypothetical protein